MAHYKIVNKQTGETPTMSNPRMTYKELMEDVSSFLAWNPRKTVVTDEEKIAYYNRRSFYRIVEVA